MDAKPKFYLTTPIYYTNGLPHIGHTYSTIVCDVIRRFKRMMGYDVVLTTGTDEHGVNVERSAKKAGVPEAEFVEKMAGEWRRTWDDFGIQGDEFIRTTDLKHAHTVQWLFRRCRENGYVYPGHYTGQYCVYDNAYVVDAKPGDNCPDCGRPTETVTEANYFFKLSAFQKPLLDLYEKHPEFIQPESRRNEVLSFVNSGLRDLSITRTTIRWGIPVPGEEPHVFYVWFDALTAYLSAVGGPTYEQQGYWPADLHLVGKEIIRFHAVYWPAFLMAAMLPLPKQIWAHGWLLFDQDKMSKSKGNVVRPHPIVHVLGMDALRYFLLREIVFGQDGNFSYDALVTRYNADLANGLGNLASRTLTMIGQYCGGSIPSVEVAGAERIEASLAFHAKLELGITLEGYERFDFSGALQSVWRLISQVDSYLTEKKPWTMAKNSAQKSGLEEVLYNATEALRFATVLAAPVIPQAAARIWKQLGQSGPIELQRLDGLRWGQLRAGTHVGPAEPVFPRVEHKETIERITAMEEEALKPVVPAAASAAAAAPVAAQPPAKIGIEDFTKVEMRVGQVKSAERVAGADKLLKVMVDIGEEVRQVVAGIAEVYKPEELVGRKVVLVVNLQPRKLRGVESNGMIVAASVPPDGKPVLAGFLEDVPVGARLK
jgi:methionyl-tRNA synthetase